MLGNDVVDLRDPDSQPESFRPRFDERVFMSEERRAIEKDRDPMARRWAHWAAKEAAFKLAKQTDPAFVFAPGRCRVSFDQPIDGAGQRLERCGIVEWIEHGPKSDLVSAEVRSFETEERIHLVALPVGGDWGAVQYAAEPIEEHEADPSAAVRRMAIREISRGLGLARHRLSVGKRFAQGILETAPECRLELADISASPGPANQGTMKTASKDALCGGDVSRIPTLEVDGEETDLALSLSHHGRWVAYAMTPRVASAHARPGTIERRAKRAEAGQAE